MSFDNDFSFGPTTPPQSFEQLLYDAPFNFGHSRSSSYESSFSQGSSPETISIQLATPVKSPIRQHGPLLLPRIRPQDQTIEPLPKRQKKTTLSSIRNAPARASRPCHTRSYTNPECGTLTSSATRIFNHSRSSSSSSSASVSAALCSPISMISSNSHQRRASGSNLDVQTLGKYVYPTYRQMPVYISSSSYDQDLMAVPMQQSFQRSPSPMRKVITADDFIDVDDGSTTTLMSYLSTPNPAPSLVHHLNVHLRDPLVKHFWWDIRQVRPWTSFSTATISSIPGLVPLLSIPLPSSSFPVPDRTSAHPETEAALHNIISTSYLVRLNASLALSQGNRHLIMRSSTPSHPTDPSFISAYTDDNSALIYGRGLGRVVGLVKSFDRFNTGMRVEAAHKKVEYLRGLAHLHRCMREHGCRYGFIITEIELVVVRLGTERVPDFGSLEVATVQLAEHSQPVDLGVDGDGEDVQPAKMTAGLALWYLHMLARDEQLQGQCGWKLDIGAPAEGTRRKCRAKETWIPEPQVGEKREAKRARGWVWPEDPINRKELGKRGVRYG